MFEKKLVHGLSNGIDTVEEYIDQKGDKQIKTVKDVNEDFLVCVKCDNLTLLEACKNCNHYPKTNCYGNPYTCERCGLEHHQNRWLCKKCNCDNPIQNRIFHYQIVDIIEKAVSIIPNYFALIISILIGAYSLNLAINNDGSLWRGLIMPFICLVCLIGVTINLSTIIKQTDK